MTKPLWAPSAARIANANITKFAAAAGFQISGATDYQALHSWSVDNPEAFWTLVWQHCGVVGEGPGNTVLEDGDRFPGARWFPQARLNFAENMLRRRDEAPALVGLLASGSRRVLTYRELYEKVAQLSASLRAEGVGAGDRVAGFMPNIVETVVAMLATTSLGAVWSSCSPDFGVAGVMDRFGQIAPKVLFAADGYYYNGKTCDSLARIAEIAKGLDSLARVVVTPVTCEQPELDGIANATLIDDFLDTDADHIEFARLPFDHPLYVMFSSGTTGVPKCIVHSAGGTLLQHLKEHQLHTDISAEDVLFYFTTCGWMMWNWLVSGLASEATVVLYDGSPFARDGHLLLDAIDSEGITAFGTSPRFLSALEKAGQEPLRTHSLASLNTILSTGSPLSHENFDYVYRAFKTDVCLSSISGGTDIISCFVGGCPVLPVFEGEIQAAGLGMAVEIWNEDGAPLQEQKGELVCTRPFPCAPVGFWNDADGARYRAAYFERFSNVWAHGDYGEKTARGGFIIHGRSDAVLNPGGVRIGTAEIYRQVEKIPGVVESVVIGQQWEGDVRVVLFVLLREGVMLDEALIEAIRSGIRKNTTPRHVPAKIVQVADIPRTRSGKIVELAVRKVVHGETVNNTEALENPEALALFRALPELASS